MKISRLSKGEVLGKDKELKSENGKFTAKIEQDGYINGILTSFISFSDPSFYFKIYYYDYLLWKINWAVDRIEMQTDGNLVIYDPRSNAFQTPNTSGRGDYAILLNDATVTVYDARNNPLWKMGSLFCKLIQLKH